jgi:hypothetical protein
LAAGRYGRGVKLDVRELWLRDRCQGKIGGSVLAFDYKKDYNELF